MMFMHFQCLSSDFTLMPLVNNRGPVTLHSLQSNWVMEAGLKYQACCGVGVAVASHQVVGHHLSYCWSGGRCVLGWGVCCRGWQKIENGKFLCEVQSLLIRCELQSRDQSRKRRREQTAAAASHQALTLQHTSWDWGPALATGGPRLSSDQPGQPCWLGGWGDCSRWI